MSSLLSLFRSRPAGSRRASPMRPKSFRPRAESLEDRLTPTNLPPGFTETLLLDGLPSPTSMALAPDGRLFLTEQSGRVLVVKDGDLLSRPFVTLPVDDSVERGLLGLAFDPDFVHNHHVYVTYTAKTPTVHNRVSRFTADGDVAIPGSEFVVLELDTQIDNPSHVGGALHFGPDGKLYVAHGDNGQSSKAQTLDNDFGKILRINADGSTPEDNPFLGAGPNVNPNVWALGLRNPFTFAIQPGTGRVYINDVGEATWEEINEGRPGANFGWPLTEGRTSQAGFTSPLHTYRHTTGPHPERAITAGVFYNPESRQFPDSYEGRYFFADFTAGWIRTYDPVTRDAAGFATELPSFLVDLDIDPSGSLYYLARDPGKVFKIEFPTASPPHVTFHPSPQTVAAGQPVTFRVSASGSRPLTYQWQRDGVDIPGATSDAYTLADPILADNGALFRAVVTNSLGTAASRDARLSVLADLPPVATIMSPSLGSRYAAGDVITYTGTAVDQKDGDLPASAFTWQIDFHHDEHVHPFLPPTTGVKGGIVTIPTTGEKSANVWYEVILTVQDSSGLSYTTSRNVVPRTALLAINTSPAGLQVLLDGQPMTTPFTVAGVVGMRRELNVIPTQTVKGLTYTFEGWAGGHPMVHRLTLLADGASRTAGFHLSRIGDGRGPDDNRLFVAGLYQDLLGRTADPTGLEGFLQLLDTARRPLRTVIAQDFLTSPERRGNLVRGWYRQYLGRSTGPAELATWLEVLASGRTTEQVEGEIAGSEEAFRRQGRDPARWLDKVYQETLDRARDAGSQTLLEQLRRGTPRSRIVLAILDSPEYRENLVAEAYRTYLGRRPSGREVELWRNRIEQLLAGVLASDERFRKSGNANGGWVEGLYTDLLGRRPDSDGFRRINERLHRGYATVREDVAATILRSDEYLNRQIDGYYRRLLGRQSGSGERASWVTFLRRGGSQQDVVVNLLTSPEYFRRQGQSNKEWLDQVFIDLFRRARGPTTQPLRDALDRGDTTRREVALFFVTTPEYRSSLLAEYIGAYLKRKPSEAERSFALASFQRGARYEQIQAVVLASTEYAQGIRS